jgi:hypothetical protein
MDRELQVLKSGYLLGKLSFTYETETYGNIYVKVNRIIDITGGLKTVIPLYEYNKEISHDALLSTTAAENFDKLFFEELPDVKAELDSHIEFKYVPVHYRYLVSAAHPIGIADIYADFSANKKEVHFISAMRMHDDYQLSSNSIEGNINFLKRTCELQHLGCVDANFDLIDHQESR